MLEICTKMKIRATFVFLALTLLQLRSETLPEDEWDYLLFVQHWPYTVCSQWEEKSLKNTCTLPRDKTLWTIHGIWPSRVDMDGPNFCNATWRFNETELQSLMPDLERYWTNIQANTKLSSLWKHEWRKHGTCAAVIDGFDSEVDYFQQGLTWIKRYSIGKILAQNNILPGNKGYTVDQIRTALKQAVGKNAIIQCLIDPQTKESFISEIRLCFNKTLDIIDCDIGKVEYFWDYFDAYSDNRNLLTNCDVNKPIMYLQQLPRRSAVYKDKTEENQYPYSDTLTRVYNMLQFLIWATI